MKEKYLKPSAEIVLFDVNEVNMAISLSTEADGERLNILKSLEIGDGLIE